MNSSIIQENNKRRDKGKTKKFKKDLSRKKAVRNFFLQNASNGENHLQRHPNPPQSDLIPKVKLGNYSDEKLQQLALGDRGREMRKRI